MENNYMMQRVFNLSGGKSSAYMTLMYARPGDLVIFCDTGREHPKTYKFLNDFEAFEKIQVIRLKHNGHDKPFDEMLLRKGYRVIPNMRKRICTVTLKIETAKKYLRMHRIFTFENYLGFRLDEPRRVRDRKRHFKKVIDKFPLYENGITKEMINQYWETKPYTLEIPPILGNCTLCFMKGKSAIMSILRIFPELADPWINDEEQSAKIVSNTKKRKNSGRTYFKDVTIKQLRDSAQNSLFKDYQIEEIRAEFSCACTT